MTLAHADWWSLNLVLVPFSDFVEISRRRWVSRFPYRRTKGIFFFAAPAQVPTTKSTAIVASTKNIPLQVSSVSGSSPPVLPPPLLYHGLTTLTFLPVLLSFAAVLSFTRLLLVLCLSLCCLCDSFSPTTILSSTAAPPVPALLQV